MRTSGSAVVIGLLAVIVVGCAAFNIQPSAELTTLSPAWPNWFTLDWTVEPETEGTRRITGVIRNSYGEEAMELQLLTQALDASGTVIGQRLSWVGGGVPPLSRAYFQVRGLPPADQYRVTVWSFTFRQGMSWF